MALVLCALLGLRVADLNRRGMSLSTTSFIDPAGVLQVTAWDVYNARRLRNREFPLWNPYNGIGQPHLANLQTAVFYPLKIPFYLTGTMAGHDLYLFIRLVLLGLGPFLLLRALGAGRWGSAFGSIAFGCGGYALWFANLVELNNQVLTPFLMIALVRLGLGFTPRRLLVAALLVAIDIFGGHPEGIFVTGLFSGLFALYWILRQGSGIKCLPGVLGRWLGAAALGFFGASIVMIPFIEYFPRAWNFHFSGMGFLHLWRRAPLQFLSAYLSPLASGGMWRLPDGVLHKTLWDFYRLPYGAMEAGAGFPYIGLTAAAFMVGAALSWRKLPAGGGFFIAFFISAASFSMGLFPLKLLSFVPPFNVANNGKFYFAEIAFCASVLAGMGLDVWLRRDGEERGISSDLIFPASLAALLLPVAVLNDFAGLRSNGLYAQMAAVGALALFIAVGPVRWRPHAAIACLIIELALMAPTVKPYLPLDWGKTRDAKWLGALEQADPYAMAPRLQVQGDFLLPPNLNLPRGFSDIRSSDALFPKNYFDWLNRLGGLDESGALYDFYPRYYARLNDKALSTRDAAIMGLRYLVSQKRLARPGQYKLTDSGDPFIYERADVCPTVFFWLAERRSCIPLALAGGTEEHFVGVAASRMDTVVFNQLDYPGWRAILETETDSEPAETALKPLDIGIPLQAYRTPPEHGGEFLDHYHFYYNPVSFKIGYWATLATLVFGLFLFFFGGREAIEGP